MDNLAKINPSQRNYYHSSFDTTGRYESYDWLLKLILIPTYLMLVTRTLITLISWILKLNLRFEHLNSPVVWQVIWYVGIGLLLLSIIPVVTSMLTLDRPYWRMGYKRRKLLTFVALLWSVLIIWNEPGINPAFGHLYYQIYVWTIAILLVAWFVRWLLRRRLAIQGFTASVALVSLGVILVNSFPESIISSVMSIFPYAAIAINALALLFFSVRKLRETKIDWHWRSLRKLVTPSQWVTFLMVVFCLIIMAALPNLLREARGNGANLALSVMALAALFTAGRPRQVLSRQRAYIRNLLAASRQDNLRNIASPTLEESNFINKFRIWFSKYVVRNQYLWLTVTFVFGAVIIPLIQITAELNAGKSVPDILSSLPGYIVLGLSSGLLLCTLYFIVWIIRHRQRFIVLPLEIKGTDEDKEQLSGVANLLTHSLVEQIQQIGMLFKLRQVENTHTSAGSVLAHFVASGQEPEFINELQSLVNFDDELVSNRLFGRLFTVIINQLAFIKVQGTLRKRADNQLELWFELSRRRSQSVAVGMSIVPPSFSEDLDEVTVHDITRELAIKLVLKLGRTYHLASSWQSLDQFLEGLQAAAEHNWWRAIDAYRMAIQTEEATKSSFGLGHYHLGATLLALGEIDDGIKHLQQAEISGPPLAETYYMLALALINQHWSKLDTNEVKFREVERYCRMALELRPKFPDVHHLLASAHYQRGRLRQRLQTRKYRCGPIPNLKSLEFPNEYRRTIEHSHKAIKGYDQELDRLLYPRETANGVQGELDRLLQARMMCTHQLADALRALNMYQEADSYYEDVLAVYPSNVRTLIDRMKLYCLNSQWQRADEFLSRNIFTLPEAEWDADVHIYAGWAYAGGVADKVPLVLWPYTVFNRVYNWWDRDNPKKPVIDELVSLLGQSVFYLSYALQECPTYMTRWWQTDWQTPFMLACTRIERFLPTTPATSNPSGDTGDVPSAAARIAAAAVARVAAARVAVAAAQLMRLSNAAKQPKAAADAAASPPKPPTQRPAVYEQVINPHHVSYLEHLKLVLAWRMDSYNYDDPDDPLIQAIPDRKKLAANSLADLDKSIEGKPNFQTRDLYPHPQFAGNYLELKALRDEYSKLLDTIDQTGRLHGIRNTWARLQMAAKALNNWKDIKFKLYGADSTFLNGFLAPDKFDPVEDQNSAQSRKDLIKQNTEKFKTQFAGQKGKYAKYSERWAVFTYLDIAVFTVRILAEAGAYETAWCVADESIRSFLGWVEVIYPFLYATEKNDDTGRFRISPYAPRRHLATLHAFKAYSAVQLEKDGWTRSRFAVYLDSAAEYPEYEHVQSRAKAAIQSDIKQALQYLPRHALTLYTQAALYRENGLFEDAANELYRLLNVIAPLDPFRLIANWEMVEKHSPSEELVPEMGQAGSSNQTQEMDHVILRERMRRQAATSGEEMLSQFVSRAFAHQQLAAIYAQQGQNDVNKLDLASDHLTRAATWAVQRDVEADILLDHAELLEKTDRFRDGQAVVKALHNRRYGLDTQTFSVTKLRQPEILNCVMTTRMNQYSQSLAVADQLWWDLEKHGKEYLRSVADYKRLYEERLTRLDIENNGDLAKQLAVLYTRFIDHMITIANGETEAAPTDTANGPAEPTPVSRLREQLKHITLSNREANLPLLSLLGHNKNQANSAAESQKTLMLIITLAMCYLDTESTGHVVKYLQSINKCVKVDNLFIQHQYKGKEYRTFEPRLDICWNITIRILDFFSREALSTLEQFAQLINNIVYNRAVLHIDYDETTPHMRRVISLQTSNFNGVLIAIDIVKRLIDYASANKDATSVLRYRQYLRNYYDTLGWVLYRDTEPYPGLDMKFVERLSSDYSYDLKTVSIAPKTPDKIIKQLEIARACLEEIALKYDQSSSIVYYHLARIHLAMLERRWQQLDAINQKSVSKIAAIVQEHLRLAGYHVREAGNHDYNGRLRSRLNWLTQRVNKYAQAWETRHLNEFIGPKPKAED